MQTSLNSLAATLPVRTTQLNNNVALSLATLTTTKATTQATKSTDLAGLMKTPLSSLTNVTQSKENQASLRSSMASFLKTNDQISGEVDDLMETPLPITTQTATRKGTVQNESSIVSVAGTSVVLKPAEVHATSFDSLAPSSFDRSPKGGHELLSSKLIGCDSVLTPSPNTVGQLLTSSKKSVLSDLQVKSDQHLPGSSKFSPSLSELAKNDKYSLSSISNGNVADLKSRKDFLSDLSSANSNETVLREHRIDLSKSPVGSNHNIPNGCENVSLLAGRQSDRNHDPTLLSSSTLLSSEDVQISLKHLSLEHSLITKRKHGATASLTSDMNMSLNEDGAGRKSYQDFESSFKESDYWMDSASYSNDVNQRLRYDDIVMKPPLNGYDPSLVSIRNRVRKRKASSFGQALSSLHEPSLKVRRRELLYNDTNQFLIPCTINLRGLFNVKEGRVFNAFNFSTPSQDDLVRAKQNNAFLTKRKLHP